MTKAFPKNFFLGGAIAANQAEGLIMKMVEDLLQLM